MKFAITIETDSEAGSRSALIQSLSDKVAAFLVDKNYGSGIKNVLVGAICMRRLPGENEFFKVRKPRYIENKKVKLLDGSIKSIEGLFSYDFEFDIERYEEFVDGTEEQAKQVLQSLFIDSLANFEKLPKKVKSFDLVCFRSDLVSYLRVN